uniref:Proteasomal ubiquitin receptor ADRM1 homolog n=1 Tax=Clastoptera arizonana TaxID=38151 RepID=A0A1B6CH85_9HEMI
MPAIGAALFGNSASRSQNKNLVEFKAGKMTMKGKMVHADKRKGLLFVFQSDDSLMHFCWKDRTSGTIEDDLIIFPDDCEFKRVSQCKTGRVYVLKFKSSNRKFFFWVQEPKNDKDDENARKINEVLNNPPTPGSQRSGGATPDGDLQNLLSNMSQQQLAQLFGGVNQIGLSSLLGTMNRPSSSQSSRPTASSTSSASTTSSIPTATATNSTPIASVVTPAAAASKSTTTTTGTKPVTTTTTTTTTSASSGSPSAQATAQNPIQLSDLQNFLTGLGVSAAGSSGANQPNAITSESLQAVLNDPNTVLSLQQHLPSIGSGNLQDQLRSTLSSPQFNQALNMFSTALRSGQLGPVVSQLEVGPEAVSAATQGNMEEFVNALQNASISQQENDSEPKQPEKRKKTEEKKKDDDEDMALD